MRHDPPSGGGEMSLSPAPFAQIDLGASSLIYFGATFLQGDTMAGRVFKEMRRCYGFEEVAIVPGAASVNPEQTCIDFALGNLTFSIPIVAAAMDAVVDAKFAALFSKLGGLAVLNLEGIQARYEKPEEILHQIAAAPGDKVAGLLQQVYSQPIKEQFVGERIRAIKKMGGICAASVTPANTKRLAPVMVEAGADVLVVQSTVTTARHTSKSLKGLVFSELCRSMPIPVVVGNCVSYSAALESDEDRHRRSAGRRRPRSHLHHQAGPGHRRAPGDRHHGLRRCAGRLFS